MVGCKRKLIYLILFPHNQPLAKECRMRRMFIIAVATGGLSTSMLAQERGYSFSRRDDLSRASVLAVLQRADGCTGAAWSRLFHATCDQLISSIRRVDPGAVNLNRSSLAEYLASLSERNCPVGTAQLASIRKRPGSATGVVDFHFSRAIGLVSPGLKEKCLYRETIPVLSLSCWNPIGGFRTLEELAAKPQTVEVERTVTDTLRVQVGDSSVRVGNLEATQARKVFSVLPFAFVQVDDLRTPRVALLPAKPASSSLPPAVKKNPWPKRLIGGAIVGGLMYGAFKYGQSKVVCLACRQ